MKRKGKTWAEKWRGRSEGEDRDVTRCAQHVPTGGPTAVTQAFFQKRVVAVRMQHTWPQAGAARPVLFSW